MDLAYGCLPTSEGHERAVTMYSRVPGYETQTLFPASGPCYSCTIPFLASGLKALSCKRLLSPDPHLLP